MNETSEVHRRGFGKVGLLVFLGLIAAALGAWLYWSHSVGEVPTPGSAAEATGEQVRAVCGVCHAYPPPDCLPRSAWRKEVQRGFEFFHDSGMSQGDVPEPSAVTAHYENRAPAVLPIQPRSPKTRLPLNLERRDYTLEGATALPAISNVRLAHYSDPKKLDVLACDMLNGRILLLRPYVAAPKIEVLCDGLSQPAHVEVVDLDGDGVKDLLVANLGNFYPTNDKCGSVVWLRGTKDGAFERHLLLKDVGRVADAQAADLNGDGKLDVAVAVFGWNTTGEVVYLENQTTEPAKPRFQPRVLDGHHGAIHVPIGDLNGDGTLDIVALLSQEQESVVAFLNDGKANFTREKVFAGPHPAFGSSGIQLVDLNRDGRLDVLYTNGDSLDTAYLRPYHGVRWLENRGSFPFADHFLTPLYGVHRALAADLRGAGKLDIVAVSLLPRPGYGMFCKQFNLDAMILLEETSPGRFARHALETIDCNHATLDVGDFDADGKTDFVSASFVNFGVLDRDAPADTRPAPWISVWRTRASDSE